MSDAVTALEERINGDILVGLKALYERVGALAVPVEQSIASHVRTLLGEAHQAILSVEESPAARQAVAVAEEAAAAVDQAPAPVAASGAVPVATGAQPSVGAPVGTVEGAGQAPTPGAGDSLPQDVQESLSQLADRYEAEREKILAGGTQSSTAADTQTAAPALPALNAGTGDGSPTGAV